MWGVFKRIFKDRQQMLFIYLGVNFGLLWMYIALFPTFSSQSAALEEMIKTFPESFMKAFNFDMASLNTIEGFLSTEQYSFFWPMLVIALTLGFAGTAIAGEVEKGTIEILLSQPISRTKLFLSRFFAGVYSLLLFAIVSIFIAIPLMEIYKVSYTLNNFFILTLMGFLFGLSILSLGFCFSSIFSDKNKVYFLTGGLVFVSYALNIVSSLKENLDFLKYGSLFYYFNPSQILLHSELSNISILFFVTLTLAAFITGIAWINKRDIAT